MYTPFVFHSTVRRVSLLEYFIECTGGTHCGRVLLRRIVVFKTKCAVGRARPTTTARTRQMQQRFYHLVPRRPSYYHTCITKILVYHMCASCRTNGRCLSRVIILRFLLFFFLLRLHGSVTRTRSSPEGFHIKRTGVRTAAETERFDVRARSLVLYSYSCAHGLPPLRK
jgi:hypothetical protein